MKETDLKSLTEAQKASEVMESYASILGLVLTASVVLDIIGNLDGKYVFDFRKFHMQDLKYHWHEMLEQVIMESFEY